MDRREFLAFLGLVATTSVLADPQKESGMYGLIVKITVTPGRRDEMIGILKESAADMTVFQPRCLCRP